MCCVFPAAGQTPGPDPSNSRPASPIPDKQALLVLLENGGVSLRGLGLSPPQGLSIPVWMPSSPRGAPPLARLARTMNPASWKPRTINIDSAIKLATDYLLEEFAKRHLAAATPHYDRVLILEDDNFTAARVLETIASLKGYTLDIHIMAHGNRGFIAGQNRAYLNEATFFRPLREMHIRGEIPPIRTVYQMNCMAGTLFDQWLAVGTLAVCGTSSDSLNMMPTQYFAFLRHWLRGKSFADAVLAGYAETRPAYERLYSGHPALAVESAMLMSGDGTQALRPAGATARTSPPPSGTRPD